MSGYGGRNIDSSYSSTKGLQMIFVVGSAFAVGGNVIVWAVITLLEKDL